MRSAARAVCCACVLLLPVTACGKRGSPLAPLRPIPPPVVEPKAVRIGSDIRLQFTLPAEGPPGQGPLDLVGVEIYAATIPPGGAVPARELLRKKYLLDTVPVQPLPDPDDEQQEPRPENPGLAAAEPEAKDERPAPGERVTFVDTLTPADLVPNVVAKPVKLRQSEAAALAAAQPAPRDPVVLSRIYFIQGVSRHGTPAAPGSLIVPMIDPPPPPGDLQTVITEAAFNVGWTPPLPAPDPVAEIAAIQAASAVEEWLSKPLPAIASPAREREADVTRPEPAPLRLLPGVALPIAPPVPPRFNVYEVVDGTIADVPLNPLPLVAPAFSLGAPEWGRERCLVVRTVLRYGMVSVESDGAGPECVTPRDTFAPAAPTGLRTVASPGVMNLIWNANAEADLAGYLVLRAEAPDGELRPITDTPIRETTYKDTTVKPGVRYVYAIVAVDNADPPNRSPESATLEEVAR